MGGTVNRETFAAGPGMALGVRLAADALAVRHAFSGRHVVMPPLKTLVAAHGRVPNDTLWTSLEFSHHAQRAGDVLGPRTLEEAILEGALNVMRK